MTAEAGPRRGSHIAVKQHGQNIYKRGMIVRYLPSAKGGPKPAQPVMTRLVSPQRSHMHMDLNVAGQTPQTNTDSYQ